MKLSMIPGPTRPIVLINGADDKGHATIQAKRSFGNIDIVFVNNGVSIVLINVDALHDTGLKRLDGSNKITLLMKGVKPRSTALKQLERLLPDTFADLIALKEIPADLGKLTNEALGQLGFERMTEPELEAYLEAKLTKKGAQITAPVAPEAPAEG